MVRWITETGTPIQLKFNCPQYQNELSLIEFSFFIFILAPPVMKYSRFMSQSNDVCLRKCWAPPFALYTQIWRLSDPIIKHQ